MFSFPLLLTIYAGFAHAFETDHLLAVSNLVSQRNNAFKSMKDGIFWGLGHTSSILLVGMLILLLKVHVNNNYFHFLEAGVGVMLVIMGFFRLSKLKRHIGQTKNIQHQHQYNFITAMPATNVTNTGVKKLHFISYVVGAVHGLGGSGELVLLVMLQIASPQTALMFLLIFGIGSILGMLLAAALFSIPFSKKLFKARALQVSLILLSGFLCIGFGVSIVYKNLLVLQ